MIEAVIFDWGGTLTPWHQIDLIGQWYAYSNIYDPMDAGPLAHRLAEAEVRRWQDQHATHGVNGTGLLDAVFEECGVDLASELHAQALASYYAAWDPHTLADPHAERLFAGLRDRGIKIGVLSNTMWSRAHHEKVFERDGLLGYIDGAIYTSEISVGKPHAEAFRSALDAVGVEEPSRAVFVGDRLWDDIHGAASVGLRTIFIPHSVLPADQLGPGEGEPDAVAPELIDVLGIVDGWVRG